ncbi:MAG: [protein-PII] uridylyltransferase [Alphaproteobacteria bacterium]
MPTLVKPKEIINVDRLFLSFDQGWSEGQEAGDARGRLFEICKGALTDGREEIKRRFEEEDETGETNVCSNSYLIDHLLQFALTITTKKIYPTAEPTSGERICVVCTGGYGRGELAPCSDVDLMFLLPYRLTPRVEQIIESTLYLLWDLGLKVGHATRNVQEVLRLSQEDITIRTGLLESRFLWGNKKLFNEMRRTFKKNVVAESGPKFAEAKLDERDKRHVRMGDSRYVLEPNIKEGKGGLRDLHTLFWIAKYLYQVESVGELLNEGVLNANEVKRFSKAQNFLWTIRSHLHYIAGRGEDRLTFDVQAEIGRRMGYRDHAGTLGVERFMKHYYLTAKEVGDLTRIFCAALEAEQKRWNAFPFRARDFFRREIDGFKIESGRLTVSSGAELINEPIKILRLFRVAQKYKRDIHPRALRLITRHLRAVDRIREDEEANKYFIDMLTAESGSEITLRRLNEAGVFGRFLPDFGRVVAQMQHDMYHVYTVDEHTIFAIGILQGIEQGMYKEDMPVATEAMQRVVSRRALFVAMLFHDIAKGRGGDHSVLGAEVSRQICPRLGLTSEETETVEWLVRYHLLMSHIAFHRDLIDPKTIVDFVERVQSLERLRLLLCLTVADIRAVGPNVWNNWKASLLRELYYKAESYLSGGHESSGTNVRVENARGALAGSLRCDGWEDAKIEEVLALGYPSYWLSLDADAHRRNADLISAAIHDGEPIKISASAAGINNVTEITIHTPDHPGLFSTIAGAIAVLGGNIVGAKIFTMANGMALDIFTIQETSGGAFSGESDLKRLIEKIESALRGEWSPGANLREKSNFGGRENVFLVAPRVLVNNSASRTHSVVEINGSDRPGFLHDVTRKLADLGLQISSALVTTYGERVVDIFYVKDVYGMQITNERKLEQVKNGIQETLAIKSGHDDEL